MKIKLDEVKLVFEKILNKLEKDGYKEVDIVTDFYWDIDSQDAYQFDTDTPPIIVGSLKDDWDGLSKIVRDQNPATIIDFQRLASIIKILGEFASKLEKKI